MIYLDYAANTPVDHEVLDCFYNVTNQYYANPNSTHFMGKDVEFRMNDITNHIIKLLELNSTEVIYTSGASEANNLAIKGYAEANIGKGKHIISTCLEHSSISATLTYLQSIGYEIDLVDIMPDGLIDIEHLKTLLRKDTILVTIVAVDSEMGIQQNLIEIANIIKEYSNCAFHTDATQAIGKVKIDLNQMDLVTFAPHKFYGLNGCGVLLKSKEINLFPMIHGGASTTSYRSGTPNIGLVASIEKSIEKALNHLSQRFDYVSELNQGLRENLLQYKGVKINSTENSTPYILNISIKGVKAKLVQEALGNEQVAVSIKSACAVDNAMSRSVYAVTKDRKNAMSSWRISLSHLTSKEEVDEFLKIFNKVYYENIKMFS